ncbi:MAG: uroporphyrinogen-III synthase [Lentilitoribacter sp.]
MAQVLILRSEPAASETARKIQELGHQPVLLPLKECICQTDIHLPKPGETSGFVFTSANALRCLNSTVNFDQALLSLPAYCVGAKTSEIAKEMGFCDVTCGEGGGKSLAKDIIRDQDSGKIRSNTHAPLHYFTLEKRTPDLELSLNQTNIHLKPIISYEMVDQISDQSLQKTLENSHIDIVLFYAKSAVRRFFAIEDELQHNLFTNMQFGCLSKEIAGAIPKHFARQTVIAEKPNETHLLACIG